MRKTLSQREPNHLVCFGASAGGLAAFRRIAPSLDDSTASYVYCQHLSPSHESQLVEIIARDSDLPVITISQDLLIQPGHLYIVPPNQDVVIKDKQFCLSPPTDGPFPKPSINKFFSSAAETFGEKLVVVVLSGSGSDGALGVVRVRSRGGLVLVQDPSESEFKGMPESVININAADSVCALNDLGKTINRVLSKEKIKTNGAWPSSSGDAYNKIIDFIKNQGMHNLAEYRESTITRRIHRRMSLRGVKDIYAYYQLIMDEPEELASFINDAFIIVSSFYRDPAQFYELKDYLTKKLVNKSSEQPFRVWIPACACGEEAFTLAMLLTDVKRKLNIHLPLKIMASDISPQAIETARSAEYLPDKFNTLPKAWKTRYFEKNGGAYVVKPVIREMVLFSVHNILADPPFSRLDLISCRNLLIYFNQDQQQKLLKILHYSLKEQGVLFLGSSESVGDDKLFEEVKAKSKVFVRRPASGTQSSTLPAFLFSSSRADNVVQRGRKKTDAEKIVYKALLESQGLSAVVLDARNALAFTIGNYYPLFSNQGMFVSENALDMLEDSIRACCRAMVHRVRRNTNFSETYSTQLDVDKGWYKVLITIRALGTQLPDWVVIAFSKLEKIQGSLAHDNKDDDDTPLQAMEQELSATRENLQTVIEELETSNEQLAVYNEELQVANEEFRSTNEELQTVIEELQSTNEELMTVNDEFNQKSLQQARLSADLNNIQESLALPVIVINREYRIQRLTNSCKMILDIEKFKENDLFFALQWYIDIPDLKMLIDEVQRYQEPRKTEISHDNKTYECQISPYRNGDDEFDGYTIIFVETTQLKSIQAELAKEKQVAQTTLETITEGVIRVDRALIVEFINPVALSILQRDVEDMLGKGLANRLHLFDDKGEPVEVSKLIHASGPLQSNSDVRPVLVSLCTQYGETIHVEFTSSSLSGMNGFVITLRDVTERQSQLKSLRWQSQRIFR